MKRHLTSRFLFALLVLSLAACPRPGFLPPTGRDLVPAAALGSPLLGTLLNLMKHTAWVSRPTREIRGKLEAAGFRLLGGLVLESRRHGTQAYAALHGDDLVIAFRGTGGDTLGKWVRSVITDARFLPRAPRFLDRGRGRNRVRVHTGFLRAYSTKRAKLLRFVRAHPGKRIWLTGHSLGAAMATLAAADIAVNLGRKVHAVLFASPRVGNPAFAELFARSVRSAIRIERVDDPITQVPPYSPIARYVHVGKLLAFKPDGALATPAELAAGFKIPLRVKVHFQPHYRKLVHKLARWCANEPSRCEAIGTTDRLAAAAQAARKASRHWWKAGKRLFRRLFKGLFK